MNEGPTRILFVCLGNICRSPLAEGVFKSLLRARSLTEHYRVDSAGTGAWHVGEGPDRRATEVARRHGVTLEGRARQVAAPDFVDFDYLVAMDRQNLSELSTLTRRRGSRARLHLLREFDPDPGDRQVPDPYYGGTDGFETVYAILARSCTALLDHVEGQRSAGTRLGR